MEKVLVEVFFTYGKRDGRQLVDSYVESDFRETREQVLEEWASNSLDIDGDVEAFKEGTEDWLYVDRSGGDLDEPTGVVIELTSYSRKRDAIERRFNKELEKLNRQFKVEAE